MPLLIKIISNTIETYLLFNNYLSAYDNTKFHIFSHFNF